MNASSNDIAMNIDDSIERASVMNVEQRNGNDSWEILLSTQDFIKSSIIPIIFTSMLFFYFHH
jgi:hypothetical protein